MTRRFRGAGYPPRSPDSPVRGLFPGLADEVLVGLRATRPRARADARPKVIEDPPNCSCPDSRQHTVRIGGAGPGASPSVPPCVPRGAGPSFFWTYRPSGSRYFTYQAGPRARSTRNTWPVGGLKAPVIGNDRTPISGHIGDIFQNRSRPRERENPAVRGLSSGPWRNRTSNLGIKSPLLCQLS